jgi:hypothetical protein
MNCNSCFQDFLAKCEDNIDVFAKLEPNTDYQWVITDKFGNKYSDSATANDEGYVSIPISELPAGLLTEFGGNFTLQFYISTDNCTPVSFLIAKKHSCINFSVQGGTWHKNNLGCEF